MKQIIALALKEIQEENQTNENKSMNVQVCNDVNTSTGGSKINKKYHCWFKTKLPELVLSKY